VLLHMDLGFGRRHHVFDLFTNLLIEPAPRVDVNDKDLTSEDAGRAEKNGNDKEEDKEDKVDPSKMKKEGATLELNTFASASSLPQSLSSHVDLDLEATLQGEANVKGKCESLTLIPVGPFDEDLTSEDRAETTGNDDEEDDEDIKDQEDEEDEMDDSDEDSTKRIDWMVEWLDSIIFNWNRMGKSISMALGDLLSLLYKPTRNIISIIVDICSHDFVSTQHCSFFVAHDKEDIQNNSIQTFFERKDGKMLVYIGVID